MGHQSPILIAGASFTTVLCAGLLIYLWRKSKEDDSYDDSDEACIEGTENLELEFADLNAREENVASAGQAVANVQVPQHVVGSIIGKDGANIKQLRSQFGVRFNFDRDEQEKEMGSENKPTERVLEIRGQRDKVRLAEHKIKAIIAETPKFSKTEVFVPAETCGRIIGKGGSNIREMCAISGAKITLQREENQSLGNRRRIIISGTTVQIEYAQLLIKEKVEGALADTQKYGRKGDDGKGKPGSIRHVQPPCNGEYFQVFVSSAKTPTDFWVQLVSAESSRLDMMTDELNEVYGKMEKEEGRLESGIVGDLCIAPFDGGMFRAVIQKINNDRTAELLYIDFGDICIVSLDEIKEMRFEYKEMYGQAVHCRLAVDPVDGTWSEESCTEFLELSHCAQWKPIMCKVLSRTTENDQYLLQMVDTSQPEDVDVGATLVSKGLAVSTLTDGAADIG